MIYPFFLVSFSSVVLATSAIVSRDTDPCTDIGGQKWVAPSAVRACFESFPVNQTIKSNVGNFSQSIMLLQL